MQFSYLGICLQRVKFFLSLSAKLTVQIHPNPASKRNILQLNFLEPWFLPENALGNSILLQTHTVMQAKYEKPEMKYTQPFLDPTKSKLDTWRLSCSGNFLGCFLTYFLRNSIWWKIVSSSHKTTRLGNLFYSELDKTQDFLKQFVETSQEPGLRCSVLIVLPGLASNLCHLPQGERNH